ncbi:MAG: hypothetical protein ACLFTR_03600 [Candidatus Woesearchaeota archaeon]
MPFIQCPFCDSNHIRMINLNSYKCDFCGKRFSEVDSRDRLPSFNV